MTENSLLLQRAQQAHAENRFEVTIDLCRQVLVNEPNNLHASLLTGISAVKAHQFDPALQYLSRSIELDAQCFPAHVWLVYMLCDTGRAAQALPHAERALRLQPNHPEVLHAFGLCMLANGNFPAAKTAFEKALATNRTSATFLFGLSQAHERMGELPEALVSLRRAVKYSGDSDWTFKLGSLELAAGNLSKAREIAVRALETDPSSPQANYLMAKVLQSEHKDVEAISYLQKSAALNPSNDSVIQEIAREFQAQGRFSEAIEAFRQALEIRPSQGSAYFGIVTSKDISDDLAVAEEMQGVAAQDRLHPREQMMLQFAMGKAAEDQRRFGEAMNHFDEANRLSAQGHFGERKFDLAGLRTDLDRSLNLFSSRFLQDAAKGSESETPIFVVGMIRSGMTLVEQILTCHPNIGTAGETGFWAEQNGVLVDYKGRTFDQWTLQATASAYLHAVEELAPGKARVVDREPSNVLHLGIIHLAFPKSKIIHVIRDPVDTLLSMYATYLQDPPPFACDRENLIAAYQEYLRAIGHWREVLPSDCFMEMRYEDLVTNPREQIAALLEFVGLPWDEACISPEKNPRRLDAPSGWRLRQPIGTQSLGRRENYAPWLGSFSALLNPSERSAQQ